jgi:hypothetical protein
MGSGPGPGGPGMTFYHWVASKLWAADGRESIALTEFRPGRFPYGIAADLLGPAE